MIKELSFKRFPHRIRGKRIARDERRCDGKTAIYSVVERLKERGRERERETFLNEWYALYNNFQEITASLRMTVQVDVNTVASLLQCNAISFFSPRREFR